MNQAGSYQKFTSENPLQQFLIGNFLTKVSTLISDLKTKTWLDAGCGEGFSLEFLLKYSSPSQAAGIDIDQKYLAQAKKRLPQVVFKQADLKKLPFKANQFDLVLCLEVLEHFEDYQTAIDELIRVSKKYVLLSVPWEPFFSLVNLLRLKNVSRLGKDPGHLNFWTGRSFSKLAKQSGTKVLRHQIIFPWQICLLKI